MVVIKKTRANQVTLPRELLRRGHLDQQVYFQADLRGGVIYLLPLRTEAPLSSEEETAFLKKLRVLERRERGKGRRFASPADAKAYLRDLA